MSEKRSAPDELTCRRHQDMNPASDIRPEVDQLVNWFAANGGWLNPNVRIVHDDSHGFHLRATSKLTAPFTLARCPRNLTLSWLNLDPEQSVVRRIASPLQICLGKLPSHVLTYLLLIEQLVLEAESPWHPYVSCLPDQDELTTPLWSSAEERKCLEGTPLLQASADREKEWLREWKEARSVMAEAGMRGSEIFEECDFDSFKWAATIMSSRSFISDGILPEMPTFPVLFPVIDIANHSGTTKARWDYPAHNSFSLDILEHVEAGSEIFNNYGPKQNGELLLGYGFAIPDNPLEQVAIKIGLPPNALESIGAEQIPFGMDTSFIEDDDPANKPYYLRPPGHIFGRYQNLIPFLQGFPPFIVFASYMMALHARDKDVHHVKSSDVSGRLILATLLFLYRAIQIKCVNLAYPYPVTAPTTSSNGQQQYASIYRDGQAKVYHTMRRELKEVLERLRIKDIDIGSQLTVPAIVTLSEALEAMQHSFPQEHDDMRKALKQIYQKDEVEEEIWVLLLLVFYTINRSHSNSLITDWVQDLISFYPVSDIDPELDIPIQDKGLEDYMGYVRQLCSLGNGHTVWADIATLQNVDQVIIWALKVVHCEVFIIPDRTNKSLKKRAMYMRPWRGNGTSDEGWVHEEVKVLDQEPEGEPDHPIWEGKFY